MPRREASLAAGLALIAAGPVMACAVPTSVRVENRAAQPVREILVSAPGGAGANHLTSGPLAPGQAAMIVLPSCIGTYEVTAILADGRVARFPGLNAGTIRGLEVR